MAFESALIKYQHTNHYLRLEIIILLWTSVVIAWWRHNELRKLLNQSTLQVAQERETLKLLKAA